MKVENASEVMPAVLELIKEGNAEAGYALNDYSDRIWKAGLEIVERCDREKDLQAIAKMIVIGILSNGNSMNEQTIDRKDLGEIILATLKKGIALASVEEIR